MSKPKHRRCQVCNVVTARYVRTQGAGAFVLKVWARSEAGEVLRTNGTIVRCAKHAEEGR